MFAPPTKMPAPPPVKRINVNKWMNGTVSAYDDGRVPIDGLLESTNVWLDQDGVVRPRPSLTKFGPQPVGTVKGEVFQFRARSNTSMTNWMISLQTIDESGSDKTYAYIAKPSDETWTKVSGKTYDNEGNGRFCQIKDSVLVMNGKDKLSFLDIASSTVVPYVLVNDVAKPSATATGLSGTDYNVYYSITANSKVGETKGSEVVTVQVGTDRDIWDAETQSIKITWTAVSDAESYNVYCATTVDGAGTAQLYAIATGLDSDTTSFTDNGTRAQNPNRPVPKFNSTDGPVVERGYVINGRVWLTGDQDEPYLVRYGGDYGHELDFSPANGGGYTAIGNGTKELPKRVMPFRDGRGNPQITVLCQGTSGQGKRYLLTENSVTYGNTTIAFYAVTEDNGQDGTDAPDSVVLTNDSLWYLSMDGFKTTGTKPQLQNVLSTNRVSNTIQDAMSSISSEYLYGCVGLSYAGRIYWALPVGSSHNNQIWVLDLDRGGAWMKPWLIDADWMWLVTDDKGITHHMILSNNEISELSYDHPSSDNGLPMVTSGSSGQIPFSKDRQMWGNLIKLVFTLLRPQGEISVTVSGYNEDDEVVVYRQSQTFAAETTAVGWSDPLITWGSTDSWSDIPTTPSILNPASATISIDVDEDLQWFQFGWSTTGLGVDYSLADVTALYVESGLLDLD